MVDVAAATSALDWSLLSSELLSYDARLAPLHVVPTTTRAESAARLKDHHPIIDYLLILVSAGCCPKSSHAKGTAAPACGPTIDLA